MFPRLLTVIALSALGMVMAQHAPLEAPTHGGSIAHKRASAKPKGRGGQATWFHPGQGHCGGWSGDNDMIIALPTGAYGKGQYCGKKVKITNTKNKKTCIATVVDSCPGCGEGDLDVSPKVFKSLAKLDDGVAAISWDFS
ncbi:hypothetical protein BDV93DRAFT_489939 [Ceratobasidium sp. AG-I]|nr:hypothetical protein BDV93DRAFT_489939 [Ceratobasidium sp. AG-I]